MNRISQTQMLGEAVDILPSKFIQVPKEQGRNSANHEKLSCNTETSTLRRYFTE